MTDLITPPATPDEVLAFWFEEVGPLHWFAKNKKLDDRLRGRFLSLHTMAAVGAIESWRQSAESALALIIVLDQFSRNLYRDDAKSFAQDQQAVELASFVISKQWDETLDINSRMFIYMPFMHAESLLHQEESCRLFKALGLQTPLYNARLHHAIIERFGRFPHRNAILNRPPTEEELNYLAKGGLRF